MGQHGGSRARRAVAAIAGVAVAALVPLAPASADTTVVVHGMTFPSGRAAQLSFVGCQNPYDRASEQLQPYIGMGPGQAPAGQRSLGYDLAGGNAIGSLHYVDSMAATTVAGMSVTAPEGAAGVAYAGYQEPADAGTGLVWFGRADLQAAGGWQRVDAADLDYTWTKYDMLTQQRAGDPAGVARIPAFIADHGGDGPGFFTIGFGCDGHAFNMDAWRIGRPGAITTYDLEGLTTTTSIGGPPGAIDAGDSVTLRGSVTDGSGAPISGARLVLEAQDGHGWTIVDGVDEDDPTLAVAPESTTTYRWRFVDRPLAEGSVSPPFTVLVRAQGEPSEGPVRKQGQKQDKQQDKQQDRHPERHRR